MSRGTVSASVALTGSSDSAVCFSGGGLLLSIYFLFFFRSLSYFSWLVAVIFFFSLFLFLVYFLDVMCECVPSVIFTVQRTTSGVGNRPNRHNVRTTTTTSLIITYKLVFVFFHPLSPMGPINELQRCPSRVWSQGIYPSLPGSHLRVFIAMQVQHSYTSSTND